VTQTATSKLGQPPIRSISDGSATGEADAIVLSIIGASTGAVETNRSTDYVCKRKKAPVRGSLGFRSAPRADHNAPR